METKIIGKDDLNTAAALIAAGQLVAVPTETVYGLACSGLDADAVEQVYEVKGRPEVKPLSLMLHKGAAVTRYCANVPKQARVLMDKFWPGPLTMVDILPISYSSPDCRMISRASSISSRKVSLPRGQKVSWQESQCSSGFLPHIIIALLPLT